MPVIQVEAQVSAEQLLKAVEQMQEQEFEAFVTQVLLLRAQREAPKLSSSESQLLLKINQGLDDQLQDRFNELIAKRQALTITDAELEELIQLTDQIEQLDAERIESLAELARLRQRSLIEVMQDLNIQPPACV
ncbi:MAG: STAS/SEC14 domain-containing protein [Rhizonema sp. NSF051]|nr:STAS/SEC14 domain-containing protein [Rhizonema sp. NSF051]